MKESGLHMIGEASSSCSANCCYILVVPMCETCQICKRQVIVTSHQNVKITFLHPNLHFGIIYYTFESTFEIILLKATVYYLLHL